MLKINKYGFTLVETLIGILIFSIVIIAAFSALSALTIGRVRLIEKTNIEKESLYFTEKLFEIIKKGGNIDYEEYFNRKVIGTNYLSGHYLIETGFGNFGSGAVSGDITFGDIFYYCRSGVGAANNMASGTINPNYGCYNNTLNNYGTIPLGKSQRYGEYSFQFIDYNSNLDNDSAVDQCGAGFQLGDEDCDGSLTGDADDEFLGIGPETFPLNTDIKEIYLISGDKKSRTILRWNVGLDPDGPPTAVCNNMTTSTPTGSGCLGTIQLLKLEGKDWGYDHDTSSAPTNGEYDGLIDTWIIDRDFSEGVDIIVGSGSSYENYWVNIFPKTINIKDFKIYAYPNKDIDLSWKDTDENINISPYIRLQFTITSSWKNKRKMKGNFPEFNFSTTINLTDIYSK